MTSISQTPHYIVKNIYELDSFSSDNTYGRMAKIYGWQDSSTPSGNCSAFDLQ